MSEYRFSQCKTMLSALMAAGGAGVTRKQFAEVLGIKKSKHLVNLIDELVARGLAVKQDSTDSHNRAVFRYYITEEGAAEAAKLLQ